MSEKIRFTLEERPETDVYATDNGFVGIRQIVRGGETIILLTPDEAEAIIPYIKQCAQKARDSRPAPRKGKS